MTATYDPALAARLLADANPRLASERDALQSEVNALRALAVSPDTGRNMITEDVAEIQRAEAALLRQTRAIGQVSAELRTDELKKQI